MNQFRFFLWAALAATILAYLTIVAGFVLYQKHIVFVPVPLNGLTPAKYGVKYSLVTFTSSDGLALTGWWVRHPGVSTKRPVILYCHGNADNLSMLSYVVRIFYDFGFDELLFDYRCYGGSQWDDKGLSERKVDSDALAAYQWVRSQGIPEDRIIIWGHSLGSSVAAWLSTQTHPAGLILEGAFPSIYAVSRVRFPWLFVLPFMVTDKFETEHYVAQRTCPLLEIHEGNDTVIPIRLGEEVFQDAVPPKQWMVVEGVDHVDFPKVAYQYEKPIQAFVTGCLKSR